MSYTYAEHYEKKNDDAIDNAVKTIVAKPKFKRGLEFTINCLQKAALESGTQNREKCWYLHRGRTRITQMEEWSALPASWSTILMMRRL